MLTKASLTVAAALALTGVTATGALAATRHSGYAYVPAYASNAYPNRAEPTRASAHTPPADWSYNYYTPYPYLGP